MKSNPHGKCLIINNHFRGDLRRDGTDNDCSRLNDLFRTLNYDVSIKEDLNGPKMFSILQEMSMDKENQLYDSFACCILSHGDLNSVCGNDGESSLLYTQIWSLFGQNESTLRHKPKIFIIQACQVGDLTASNFYVEFDQGAETNHADMAIIKCSVPGKLFNLVILISVKRQC